MDKIEHFIDGKLVVHYEGAFDAERALCDHDLIGDPSGEDRWTTGQPTSKPVNCKFCLSVVRHVCDK